MGIGLGLGLRLPVTFPVAGGAAPVVPDSLLLETGGSDYMLLENGDNLQLE